MGLKPDWLETVGEELRLPEVVAERCVHSQAELASCRRCVDRCPLDAWVIDEEQLGIDTTRCDGCGLCVPACPGQAIAQEQFPVEREWRGRSIAMAICDPAARVLGEAGGEIEAARVRCLNAFGIDDVLRLYRGGVRHWIISHQECARCARGVGDDLARVVRRVNRLLRSRGLPRIAWSSLPAAQWLGAMRKTDCWASGSRFGRRGFFGSLLAQGAQQALGETDTARPPPPARYLPVPESGRAALYFFVPRIVEESCNGCDACVRLCPREALLYDETLNAYLIQASDCDGCGLCVDACAERAMVVDAWRELPEPIVRVPLRGARCASCGVAYHRPAAQPDGGRCAVCSQIDHQRNLFQVLD